MFPVWQGRMTLDKWTESAVDKVKKMRQIDPLDEYLQLFQAHVYIHGNQIEDAKWILENYNYNRFAIGKNPKVNAYYLYLTALVRGHGSHMDRVIDEVGKIYLRQQDSTMLLLMLLDIDHSIGTRADVWRHWNALSEFTDQWSLISVRSISVL